jgi:hypothetical protein
MPDEADIVEQITKADLDIEPLTCQGEDYIWRPAKRARVALAAARTEITRLRKHNKQLTDKLLRIAELEDYK